VNTNEHEKVAAVAIEGYLGGLAAQQVEQQGLGCRDDGGARCEIRSFVLPSHRPVVQIPTGEVSLCGRLRKRYLRLR